MRDCIQYENAIANSGDDARIKKVMECAKRGEPIKIGFIGGSITQGSLASTPQLCYAYRVYEWWCKAFPKAEMTYINAGIGGTTSEFGAARVETDLLSGAPDFVIVEFSVNDESTEHFMETYEGLIRHILLSESEPAVLLVHNVFYHTGGNAELMHGRIARHYDLPSVSMQSSIYPEIVAGRMNNRDITPDDLHPNDTGHELVASVITYYLKQVKLQCGEVTRNKKTGKQLPEPLTKNAYEKSVRYQNKDVTPVKNGFMEDNEIQNGITDCFKRGWTAGKTDDTIIFQIKGSCIAVQYRKSVKKPAPIAEAMIDGDVEHAVCLDANFTENWGDKLELVTVLEHGEYKEHELKIRVIETHENDVVPFYLVSVIGSGE